MLINRSSFKSYIAQKKYNEMALDPIKFKGEKGEDEGPYNVSVNNRLFFDEYDIYYLYQFPPGWWSAAFQYRYNTALHDAKKTGKEVNDIQNLAIKRGKVTVTFRNVNMFINHLIDKIERAVDVDHFRKSKGTPEDAERYKQEAGEHKKAGRDLGGLFGASLQDPLHLPGEKGSRTEDGQWMTKGLMGFNKDAAQAIIFGNKNKAGWLPTSTQGWLDNLDNHSWEQHRPNLSGGKGNETYTVFTGHSLENMQQKMKAAGAKPFKILDAKEGSVAWDDVEISSGKSKTISNNYFGSNKAKDEKLPMLFPGKAIDSESVKKHISLNDLCKKIDNISDDDLKEINSNIDLEIKNLNQAVAEKDLNKRWGSEEERENMIDSINHLKQMNDIKKWFKEKGIINVDKKAISKNEEDLKIYLHKKMKQYVDESKKWDAYQWNFSKHNRDSHPHDPLNVGMDNPVKLGDPKEIGLKDKTRGFGTYSPNHQSKDMLHGPESGHWENNFKNHFGMGKNGKPEHYLNNDDVQQIDQNLDVYLDKVKQKVASEPEVFNYLKINKKDLYDILSDPAKIISAIEKVGGPTLVKNGEIQDPGDVVPSMLKSAYKEIKSSYNEITVLKQEVNSGFQSSSAVRDGILYAISHVKQSSDLQNALKENKEIIIHNAEKFIRRTTGEAPFANYLDSIKAGGIEKHKKALDLKRFIVEKSTLYLNTIAQLDFTLGTRRLRKERPMSGDAEKSGEGGGAYSADFTADQQTAQHRGEYSDADLDELSKNEPALIKLIKDILEGQNSKKSDYRTFRQSSDSLSGTIGHSLEAVYDLISKAKEKDQNNIKKFDSAINNKLDSTDTKINITSDEANMLKQINAYTIYLQLCKAIVERDALRNNEKLSPKEFNLKARTKAKDMMAKAGIAGPSDAATPEDIAAQTKEKMDNPDSKLDPDEKMVHRIINSWTDKDLNAFQINVELNGLEQKAKAGQLSKRVVDLLFVMHGKPPVFGTLDPSSLAASDISLIQRELTPKELEKLNTAKANIEKQTNTLKSQQPTIPVPPVAPIAPIKPIDRSWKGANGGGLGGFRKPNQ